MLRTERLILREFQRDDWAGMHAYQNDPLYLRYYDRERMDPGESQALIAAFMAWRVDRPRIKTQLAIALAGTGEMIGNVGVRRNDPAGTDAEIGYELNPEHWGHGYATEAALAMRDWGFGEQRLTRLHAHCIADNVASSNVLEKLGMRREGLLRNHVFQKGRFWDVMMYGLLREEWAEMMAESAGGGGERQGIGN
ncbi:MAG TPA: GNAT family N-acetyltransferase, partial [Longimicrobium sp.]|uniref:GNAT family N-acetyltransferase n=1 Tax=Longimicrobium sp. TaxID=2029185 RepID=UPI002ED9593E